MRFDVITLFPELFAPFLSHGINRRAFEYGLVNVRLWQLRDAIETHEPLHHTAEPEVTDDDFSDLEVVYTRE